MSWRPYRFREVFLNNFRCFHEQCSVCLTPLTLLVGDNSTGKTSFLAALRLLWDIAYRKVEPNFRQFPYDLGLFSDIVFNSGSHRHPTDSFEIGFRTVTDAGTPLRFAATFREKGGAPYAATLCWSSPQVWVKRWISDEGNAYTDFGTSSGSWRFFGSDRRYESSSTDFLFPVVVWVGLASHGRESSFGRIEPLSGSFTLPTKSDLDVLLYELEVFPATPILEEKPFASAPTRTSPSRIYERIGVSTEGDRSTPVYLAEQFRSKDQWIKLKERLESFGHASGLFDEISIKVLGKSSGSPFQLQIGKHSKNMRRKGPKRNLVDVGYGVSQALPLVAELLRQDGPYTFLFQQPEVHLHPSAQAAFGSLFCEMAASGRHIMVETHSEYIVDRVRTDIRDARTDLRADEVSVLFFDRSEVDVRIHTLRFDEQGNVLGAPDDYGQFFMDEMRRSVGL